jgi:putative component of toxin-antitoxin plasmid stabilization module
MRVTNLSDVVSFNAGPTDDKLHALHGYVLYTHVDQVIYMLCCVPFASFRSLGIVCSIQLILRFRYSVLLLLRQGWIDR